MSAALELVRIVESAGGRFMLDGDRLGIVPATAAAPVLEQLRLHKLEIMDLISRRPAMPAGVRLIRWEPKDGPVQLERWLTVVEVDLFVRTTLAQVDARLRGKHWQAGWTLSVLLDRLAACGCIVSLDVPGKALQ